MEGVSTCEFQFECLGWTTFLVLLSEDVVTEPRLLQNSSETRYCFFDHIVLIAVPSKREDSSAGPEFSLCVP